MPAPIPKWVEGSIYCLTPHTRMHAQTREHIHTHIPLPSCYKPTWQFCDVILAFLKAEASLACSLWVLYQISLVHRLNFWGRKQIKPWTRVQIKKPWFRYRWGGLREVRLEENSQCKKGHGSFPRFSRARILLYVYFVSYQEARKCRPPTPKCFSLEIIPRVPGSASACPRHSVTHASFWGCSGLLLIRFLRLLAGDKKKQSP